MTLSMKSNKKCSKCVGTRRIESNAWRRDQIVMKSQRILRALSLILHKLMFNKLRCIKMMTIGNQLKNLSVLIKNVGSKKRLRATKKWIYSSLKIRSPFHKIRRNSGSPSLSLSLRMQLSIQNSVRKKNSK